MIGRRRPWRPPFCPGGDGVYCGLVFFVAASFFIPIVSQNVMAAYVQSIAYYKHYASYDFDELGGTEQQGDSHRVQPISETRVGACLAYDAVRNIVDLGMVYQKGDDYDAWGAVLLNDCELACKLMGKLAFLGYKRPKDDDFTKDFNYYEHLQYAARLPVVSVGCKSLELKPVESFAHVTGLSSGLVDALAKLFRALGVRRTVVVHNMQQTALRFKAALVAENINDVHLQSVGFVPKNDPDTGKFEEENFRSAINYILQNARYVVLLMKPIYIIQFLTIADTYGDISSSGDYVFFAIDHRIVTPDQYPYLDVDQLAVIQEGVISATWKPFPGGNKPGDPEHSKEDGNYGYAVDAKRLLLTAFDGAAGQLTAFDGAAGQLTAFDKVVGDALESGSMCVNGYTGKVCLDKDGIRTPDYVFQIVQKNELRHLWTVDREEIFWETPKENVTWPVGQFPPDPNPECIFNASCYSKQESLLSIEPEDTGFRNLLIFLGCLLVLILVIIGFLVFRKIAHTTAVKTAMEKVIRWPDLTFPQESTTADKEDKGSQSRDSVGKMTQNSFFKLEGNYAILPAVYQNIDVAVKVLEGCPSVNIYDKTILKDIRQMRGINHENLMQFIGVCIDSPNVSVVWLRAQRGSLQDVVANCDKRILSLDFLSSLLMDICRGMEYLHLSEIGSHGKLRSCKCLVDMRWTCRVSGYGMGHFVKCERKPEDMSEDKNNRDLMYVAPELLRMKPKDRPLYGTKPGDVYSYAIILQEAVLVNQPYHNELLKYSEKEILEMVKKKDDSNPPFRPSLGTSANQEWTQLIADCWSEAPDKRPTFHEILLRIEKLSKDLTLGFIEKLMLRLEQHAINLQEMVRQKTESLVLEKNKVDNLLYSLLPKVVADALKQGKVTKPENFESVTIYFNDIVGFTKIAAASTPMQIVSVLNSLYREYDAITDRHDAYKVETIGDSYMVASGLPVRNNMKHVAEIAHLAVESLKFVSTYKMEHLPNTPVQARIGIHTGPVLAGVVGMKMPRYCLFGETVLIANKMESLGEANRIHVSMATANQMRETKGFVLQSRGETEVLKGRKMKTYFMRRNTRRETFQWRRSSSRSPTLTGPDDPRAARSSSVSAQAPIQWKSDENLASPRRSSSKRPRRQSRKQTKTD